MRNYLLLLVFSLFIGTANAQMPSFSIKGAVKEKQSNAIMEYATVTLFKSEDNSIVSGIVTDFDGNFLLDNIKPGVYDLEISFIGFEPQLIEDIKFDRANPVKDLGVIYLGSDVTMVQEVEITALKSSMRYELDKKIVDVDKNIASSSGNASDVLATVPSIQTDIDGNVSLRGSSSFKVLINGRPSVLDANDALQQIPASTIKNIEIITNPSAKYDAEGGGGIINIILKDNMGDGFTGIVNVRGGTFNNYGGDATLSLKKKKFTYLLSGSFNNRGRPGTEKSEINTTLNDTTVSIINEGEGSRDFQFYNIKGGVEYAPTDNQYIGVNYTYGNFNMENDEDLDFTSINRTTGDTEYYNNVNNSQRSFPYHQVQVNYGIDFKNKSNLKVFGSFNKRSSDEFSENSRFNELDEVVFKTKTTEKGPSQRFRFNIDYELPIKDHSKFEFGAMQEIENSNEENIVQELDIATNEYEDLDLFYNNADYKKNIRAFYGTFSSKWNKLSYQVGVRTEYTDRTITQNNSGTVSKVKRLDLFPSAYISYNANDQHQFFLNYSKRINRPRGYYLEPNQTYRDANTISSGNPDLLPEYTHSFEAGWLFNFKKKGSWSNELYYKRDINIIQRVRIPLDYELSLELPENVGASSSIGLESSLSLLPLKWWNTDIMANVFYYSIKGSYQNEVYDRTSFSYNLRWNNYFSIKKNTKIQFSGSYSSPIANAQGKTYYRLSFDGGIRHSLLDNKLSLGVQVRDMFNTSIRKSESSGSNFDSYRENNPKGPSVVFSASYKINNFKPAKPDYIDDGGGEF